jgi:hypothetical protein
MHVWESAFALFDPTRLVYWHWQQSVSSIEPERVTRIDAGTHSALSFAEDTILHQGRRCCRLETILGLPWGGRAAHVPQHSPQSAERQAPVQVRGLFLEIFRSVVYPIISLVFHAVLAVHEVILSSIRLGTILIVV